MNSTTNPLSPAFMLIDDDPLCNTLSKHVLKSINENCCITDFTCAQAALEHIRHTMNTGISRPTILFLDINMPAMSGWDFMECYETFDDRIKQHFYIYILSSSVDCCDKEKAASNKYIQHYLVKPILRNTIEKVIDEFNSMRQTPLILKTT